MEFTKEQAITEHRKMWNWIADMIEEKKEVQEIRNLKKKYCDIHFEYENIINYCFLCHYDHMRNDAYDRYCSLCPLEWESDAANFMCLDAKTKCDNKGLYDLCCDEDDNYIKQATLAREIAELKER